MDVAEDATIRDARPADHDDVVAMTADTWPDRPGDDYLPRVFPEWIADDGRPKRTRVVEVDGRAVAIAQAVMLTDDEGWGQGLRVHPEFRRHGLSRALTVDLFDWAREAGAAVMRALVFGWNGAGLGQSRATGYRPLGAFRWVHPEPAGGGVAREAARRQPGVDPDAVSVVDDPTAAWHARDVGSGALGGLALSMDESWALSELTRGDLERAAAEERVLAVRAPDGVAGMAFRSRVFEADGDRHAEYGLATWDGLAAGAALFDAIAADAAAAGAEAARVAVPEALDLLSEASLFGATLGDYPEVVVEADLLGVSAHPARRRTV